VQGLQRDTSRAIRAAPAAIQSAPQSVQQAAQQIVRAHAPIIQGVQRDASAEIRSVGGAGAHRQAGPRIVGTPSPAQQTPGRSSTPAQATRQISAAHAPIVQGLQRDASRAIRAAPAAIQSAPRSVQQAVQQIVRAHAPIIQGVRRDASAAIRSVGGAGAHRQAGPRIVRTPSPAQQTPGRSSTPAQATSPTLTLQQRQARYVQDVERYQNNPAHTRLPQLIAQHEQKVKQYEIDPELRQYEQKLAAYNAQLAAHERAIARGQGRQEIANRLQLMRQELEGTRTSIESRKRQELAEIQMLEANIRRWPPPYRPSISGSN